QFQFEGSSGDSLKLSWTDNKGESDSVETTVG
ncbi:MAG: thiosulfate oxidation carrier complex protein SoxZ, partial [Thioalkalivibrio sp.]|nr:thiosulfate oxidation carrier complex protein SoxZ [Thioalkalivibrio sp.]